MFEYPLYNLLARRESKSSTQHKYLERFESVQYSLHTHFNNFLLIIYYGNKSRKINTKIMHEHNTLSVKCISPIFKHA
jgi:hypothetical protein